MLSLKILNIDVSIDPFGHLGQICRGWGKSSKLYLFSPRIFPGLLPLYVQSKQKNFPFFSNLLLYGKNYYSYAPPPPMGFGFGLNQCAILVLSVLLQNIYGIW